ncbi:MAG TPA: DUF2341 domain-containing protein [Kofleriaceae bacterium]|nr:DUF2341 domain-containing protein [Kofleriaceae bacterium]
MRGFVAACLLVGCYAPQPPAGAPCPADGICPSGLVCSAATNTCEHANMNPNDGSLDAPHDTVGPGPDSSVATFLYRRRLTIKNNATTLMPTGFTIRVPLGTTLATLVGAGKVRADYSDLRVIGTLGGERDRIVDPVGGVAPVALSFSLGTSIAAGTASTDYAIYYGNPNAGTPPTNGSAVFQLFDDFTSGIQTFWLQNDAPTTAGGSLVLRANHTDALTTNAAADNVPTVSAVELIATIADPNSNPTVQPAGTFYYWFGYQHLGDFTASDPWIIWIARGKGQLHGELKSPVGCETGCDGPYINQDTAAHYYTVERDGDATRFYRDGTLSYTQAVTNTTDYSLMVRNFMATSDVTIDYVRARARVTPEPTITIGAEENL